jgi:hypothetical protein
MNPASLWLEIDHDDPSEKGTRILGMKGRRANGVEPMI